MRAKFVIGLACALSAALVCLESPTFGQKVQGTNVRGRVVRLPAAGEVVIQTQAGKEVMLYTNAQTVYRLNNQVVRAVDLRIGSTITAVYEPRDDRFIVSDVTIGEAAAANDQELRGRITRAASDP